MDPLASAILLGFVLGLQHATDADHLVAVATIVSRERRFADGALVGALWGLGHMTTLTLAGVVIVALNMKLAPVIGTGLELVVAAMLILLGGLRLRDAFRAPIADHDHGAMETVHRHPHPHVHPSRRLLAAFGHGRAALATRAVGVGAVHGMAGSAAVSLLVLATLHSTASAVAYLLVFGLGTIAGMTALTAAMAYPLVLALRLRRARAALTVGAGLGSIAFGVVYAVSAF
ncbi:MAG TPA: high-affinity nickel-transport family protein [Methylomirabilota bacterium]|nr:high-affinity nickel-transport family protein [Methylomirabilota bacterium]